MQPSHEIARKLFAQAQAWAATLKQADNRFQCFTLGSIFRRDFDPNRSDLDLVAIIDSKYDKKLEETLKVIRDLRQAFELLREQLRERDLTTIPVSPSAYFTQEVEANIHRTGEPEYYRVNQFIPLAQYDVIYDFAARSHIARFGSIHPSLANAIGWTQQVRHLYLQSLDPEQNAKKLWEKLFHHIRNVLRVAGAFSGRLDTPDRLAVLDAVINYYSNSGLPVAELYQSLATGYDSSQFSLELLLQGHEALKRIAWQVDAQSARDWTYFETKHFASAEVLRSLSHYRNPSLFAIDNSVALYISPGFGYLNLAEINMVQASSQMIPDVLNSPSEGELIQFAIQADSEGIRTYLRERAKADAKGKFQTKVGLTQLDFPIPRIGTPLTLHIAPLSYWTIREFNRRILNSPDSEIMDLREESLERILSSRDEVKFPCPSALYVEVSIVTIDKKLVVVEKSRKLSALARKGFRWTCTIEEGLTWAKNIHGNQIDFRGVLERGVAMELNVKPEEIASTDFFAIALEHTHLNSALLGIMELCIPAEALKERITNSEDFGLNYRFINIESAFQDLFVNASDSASSWHPTARMRILLTLYRFYGRETVWESMIAQ